MQTILVSIDFSSATQSVVRAVGLLAPVRPTRLVLVHVYQPFVGLDAYAFAGTEPAASDQQLLGELLERARQGFESDGFQAEAHLLLGEPGPAIVRQAAESGAHFIILGSQGHGAIRNFFLGSTTLEVLKHASCPVLVIPVGVTYREETRPPAPAAPA